MREVKAHRHFLSKGETARLKAQKKARLKNTALLIPEKE